MSTSELNEQQQFLKDIKSNLEKKQTELLTHHGELQSTKEYLTTQIKNMIDLISQMASAINKTSDETTVLKLQEEIERLKKCCDEAKNVKKDCCEELSVLKSEMLKNRDLIKSIKDIIKEIYDFKVGTFDKTIEKLTSLKFCDDLNSIIEDMLINNAEFIEYVKINPNPKVKDIYNEMKKTIKDCKKTVAVDDEQVFDFDGDDDDDNEGVPDIPDYNPEIINEIPGLKPNQTNPQKLILKDEKKQEPLAVPGLKPDQNNPQILFEKDEKKQEPLSVPQMKANHDISQTLIDKDEKKQEPLSAPQMKLEGEAKQTLIDISKKLEEPILVPNASIAQIQEPRKLLEAAQNLGAAVSDMLQNVENKCSLHKTNDNGECTLENSAECVWDSDMKNCRYKTPSEIDALSKEFAKLPNKEHECLEPYSVKCSKPGKPTRCVPKWVHENDKVLKGEVTEDHFCDMEDADIEKIVKEKRSDGYYQPFDKMSSYSSQPTEKQSGGYKRKRKNPFYFN